MKRLIIQFNAVTAGSTRLASRMFVNVPEVIPAYQSELLKAQSSFVG